MKTVAIIGAGPAGLAAAYELLKYSDEYDVTIYEQEEAVGGLSRSFTFPGGTLDIGGHRFFTKDSTVQNLWNDILPLSDDGMLTRNRLSHIVFRNKLIEYPIQLNLQTIKALGMSEGLEVVTSYLINSHTKRQIKTLKDFYVSRFGEKLYSLFFQQYTEKLWGIPADKLSPDWGAQRIQRVSLADAVHSVLHGKRTDEGKRSLISSFNYPAFGSGQLWSCLAQRIINAGGTIHTNSTVRNLKCNGNQVTSILIESEGKLTEKSFDYVLSSMPLKDLITATDHCPSNIWEIATRLRYRDMIIVGLEIAKSDTSELLESARRDCWLYVQDRLFTFGRIQILNNWSPLLVKCESSTVLELEYFCNEGDALWCESDAYIASEAVRELIRGAFCAKGTCPRSTFVRRIPNAYPVYTDGYYNLEYIRNWVDSIDNLRCMGRNGQHRYNNMDHSVRAGIETAKSIRNANSDKKQLWGINEPEQYIE